MTTIQVDHLKVTAADGHRLGVYRAKPTGHCRGSVLIVQEIFGLTAHIKSVADSYAAAGYEALAPQLFDRVSVDLQVPYAQWQTGLTHARSIETALTMADLEATRLAASKPDRVALVGYCWGGRIGYLAACRLDLCAAISYYGSGLPGCLGEHPNAPMMFHFGEQDQGIPLTDVEQVRHAIPQAECHLYPAGHAFSNADRSSFDAASAALAFKRSVDFLRRHLG